MHLQWKHKSFLFDVALSKDAVLNVTNSSESFIPIQRIINDKVKLTFNDYPEEAGNYGIYNQKNFGNISFNYDRTESDLSAVNENYFLSTK
jgi:hypothetical protein